MIKEPENIARVTERVRRYLHVDDGDSIKVAHRACKDFDDDTKATETELQRVSDELSGDGLALEVRQLVRGNEPAEDLISVANETDADLIVIGLRRRTPVGKLILGSNAQRILLDAPCAVLAVKG